MGKRRTRLDLRLQGHAESRTKNGPKKEKERERRALRMIGLLKATKQPYTPAVMSWLSAQLAKPAKLITEDDIKAVVESEPAE